MKMIHHGGLDFWTIPAYNNFEKLVKHESSFVDLVDKSSIREPSAFLHVLLQLPSG